MLFHFGLELLMGQMFYCSSALRQAEGTQRALDAGRFAGLLIVCAIFGFTIPGVIKISPKYMTHFKRIEIRNCLFANSQFFDLLFHFN